MPKRVSSKISSYIKPSQSQIQGQERSQLNDETVIADMAKGFLQAQAKIGNTSQINNSQEVVDLLNKINRQLEGLQVSLNKSGNTGGQFEQTGQQSDQNQQVQQSQAQPAGQQVLGSQSEADVSQELRNLFSLLLANGSQQNTTGSCNTQVPQQNAQSQNPGQGQEQSQSQNQSQNQGGNQNNSTVAVQTAAQVLAQAQYELSNELETSLKKLKQVISESEKIANKISNLLGEENSQKQ